MSADIYQAKEGEIYSRYEIDVLGPFIRSKFKLIRRYGPESSYPYFWGEARSAAKQAGLLPLVAVGIPGRLQCLAPRGISQTGAVLDPARFELLSEWDLLAWADAQASNSIL